MQVSERGLVLIESFEGYSFRAYWDSYGHVWTVGYGETSGVGPGTTQTRAQAEADLRGRLAHNYEPAIQALGVPLNQNEYDALCSFVWNLGPGSMQWDVGRLLRAHDYAAAANAILNYDRAGGVVLAGLARRRQAERALFLTPDPPVAPADPYRYHRYPAQEFKFWRGSRPIVVNERGCVMAYDAQMALPYRKRDHSKVELLRGFERLLRDRCSQVANQTSPASWADDRYLGWRWQHHNQRMRGPVRTN